MKFIDLFAGVGGFRYGIERATDWVCAYSNEWDKYANSVYKAHYSECDQRDIRTVTADAIPDHDLLCGGFPCQSFSVAGKRAGFDDTRGTLFFEVARILRAKQPRFCLLENVKGLLSHDHGNTFKTIISTLVELGYDCQWQVLNSKDFGVPQSRERVFIVGHLRTQPRPKVFPITSDGGEGDGVDKGQISGTIDTGYARNHRQSGATYIMKEMTKNVSDAQRVYDPSGIAKTLKGLGGGMGAKTGLYAVRQPLRFLNRNQRNIEGDYSFTVDASQTSGVRQGMQIRRLTPVECERLQGFPDNWTQYGALSEKISDCQRYKMMGNAVTTNVISAIATKLKESYANS